MIRKLGLLATVLATLTMPTMAIAQEKFTFALNWFPVGDHAAYWVALDKGYFADRGLDVTLENSKGSGDSIAKVDTGRAAVPAVARLRHFPQYADRRTHWLFPGGHQHRSRAAPDR